MAEEYEDTTKAATIDVEQAALEPKSVAVDGVNMSQHSLPDLIAADKYAAAKRAASSPSRGLRFTKIVPGGAVSR